MPQNYVDIAFQLIVFLFAISVHESAHAWTASRCGDPTARMLGRVTLNPIKHIDPIGTVLLPLVAVITHIPILGWAKPTPVDPRNFRNPVRDDILTAVAGPVSNFVVATMAVLLLALMANTSQTGHEIVTGRLRVAGSTSVLVPISQLLFNLVLINVVLAVFNLIPVPPLDGSHVLRHFLPDTVRMAYDRIGIIGLLVLVYLGGGLLTRAIDPFLSFFKTLLLLLVRP